MIKTKTTMNAWKECLNLILDQGKDFKDENNRVCREMLNIVVEIESPSNDVAEPIHALNRFHKWDYPPLDKIAHVIMNKKLAPEYAYSYGPRLFNYQNLHNQVDDFIIPLLKENPESRRAILDFWDVKQDSQVGKKAIPALIMLDCKLRDGKLNIVGIIRSNDVFFGWPANMYQLHVLQQYIASKAGCKPGSITTISTSAHIFRDQFPYIETILRIRKHEI
jgi:thymidylate synthase